MKNILKLMLCLLCASPFILPQETYAQESQDVTNIKSDEETWLQRLEAQGVHVEKLSNVKLVNELSKVENKSKSDIMKEHNIDVKGRANGVYDNYSFTFYKNINVVKQSSYGTQAKHIICKEL